MLDSWIDSHLTISNLNNLKTIPIFLILTQFSHYVHSICLSLMHFYGTYLSILPDNLNLYSSMYYAIFWMTNYMIVCICTTYKVYKFRSHNIYYLNLINKLVCRFTNFSKNVYFTIFKLSSPESVAYTPWNKNKTFTMS